MPVSLPRARVVKNFCVAEYFKIAPYNEYVNGVGISKVGLQDKEAPEESKDDYCVVMNLRKPLPPNLLVPQEKDGVKIYAKVLAPIKML